MSDSAYDPAKAAKLLGKAHARFINEGATLIIEGGGGRIGIELTEENAALCDLLAAVFYTPA